MITFKTLKWKNFLSTGNAFTEIDFTRSTSTLIVGENGSGKSTMLDALCFVLFNKPFRAINKPQLVNAVNDKALEVEIEFAVGTNEYKIRRGIKPNYFEAKENLISLLTSYIPQKNNPNLIVKANEEIRKVEIKTGKVLQKIALANKYFGEGMTIFNDKIHWLTWKNKKGFRWCMFFYYYKLWNRAFIDYKCKRKLWLYGAKLAKRSNCSW